jgi:hypothetical protein
MSILIRFALFLVKVLLGSIIAYTYARIAWSVGKFMGSMWNKIKNVRPSWNIIKLKPAK